MIVASEVTVEFPTGFWRKRVRALDSLTLHVREGEVLALLGPNGAGKSTALYCFLGLLKPTSGTVKLMGEPPLLGSRIYGEIGYLPEEPHYHDFLKVEEALRYYAGLYRKEVPSAQIDAALRQVGMAESRHRRLRRCSKGMKQRLGIAQALICRPRLLFLDEPTRGLDPIGVKALREALQELHRGGSTIVINSHVLSETEAVATRVAILEKGKLVREGSVRELTKESEDTYLVEFDLLETPPDYLSNLSAFPETMKASLPKTNLSDFTLWLEERGKTLRSCSLKKRSLEESFLRTVSKGTADG